MKKLLMTIAVFLLMAVPAMADETEKAMTVTVTVETYMVIDMPETEALSIPATANAGDFYALDGTKYGDPLPMQDMSWNVGVMKDFHIQTNTPFALVQTATNHTFGGCECTWCLYLADSSDSMHTVYGPEYPSNSFAAGAYDGAWLLGIGLLPASGMLDAGDYYATVTLTLIPA